MPAKKKVVVFVNDNYTKHDVRLLLETRNHINAELRNREARLQQALKDLRGETPPAPKSKR